MHYIHKPKRTHTLTVRPILFTRYLTFLCALGDFSILRHVYFHVFFVYLLIYSRIFTVYLIRLRQIMSDTSVR